MTKVLASVDAAGQMPSAPLNVRRFTMTYAAGDTYTTNGWDITALFNALFPGETLVAGSARYHGVGGTEHVIELIPGATILLRAIVAASGDEAANAADLSAMSPITIYAFTK